MDRMSPVGVGIAVRDFVHNTFAYSFSSLSETIPEVANTISIWLHSTAYPFIFQHSAFVMLGILGFTFLSSSMFVSNAIIDSRKNLFKLASESKVSHHSHHEGLKKLMPKKHENIFVFTNKPLPQQKLHEELDGLFEKCQLNDPHFSVPLLVDALKQLHYHISFHDHSELVIKDRLLEMGWNFNVLNQAFTVIDMDLCNEIAGTYKNLSAMELATAMRSLKELQAKGFTQKKIEKYLLESGEKQSDLEKIRKSIFKVQNLHTKMQMSQERRIRRVLRMNMSHPATSDDVMHS
jgi:hypothetical protein